MLHPVSDNFLSFVSSVDVDIERCIVGPHRRSPCAVFSALPIVTVTAATVAVSAAIAALVCCFVSYSFRSMHSLIRYIPQHFYFRTEQNTFLLYSYAHRIFLYLCVPAICLTFGVYDSFGCLLFSDSDNFGFRRNIRIYVFFHPIFIKPGRNKNLHTSPRHIEPNRMPFDHRIWACYKSHIRNNLYFVCVCLYELELTLFVRYFFTLSVYRLLIRRRHGAVEIMRNMENALFRY